MSALEPKFAAFRGWSGVRGWTALAVGIGLVLRLARPEVHSLWIDEGMTVRIATASDPFAYLRVDSHPPLSFLLLRAWIGVFGESDLALRLLPSCVSCLALIAFVPTAGRWIGRERATWATCLYAVSPLLVWYAHEVRMYAFVELATLAVFAAAHWAWTRPSVARWCVLAFATACATGLHYYGALAALAVLVQSAFDRTRSKTWTLLAVSAGVLAWTPWFVEYLPLQRSGTWPLIVQTSLRDFAELPARLVATDLHVLVEQELEFVGWILGAACLFGFVVGCARALARRSPTGLDALLAACVPIAAAWILTMFAGGGFQPRYLTPAIPGVIACIAIGLLALRPRMLARTVFVTTIACAALITTLHLSENRREDYRSACTEIRERWLPGDRLMLLVCVPPTHVGATVDHYLRDRPDILASEIESEPILAGIERPPPGTRIHVLWREATICWEPRARVQDALTILEEVPARFRIHRLLTVVP